MNSSKSVLIAGALVGAILIIATGLYVYNSAASTIVDSMTTMSTQEIETFNNQFTVYEGKQTGTQVKALMSRLIANVSTYEDETNKVPSVYMDQVSSEEEDGMETVYYDSDDKEDYVDALNEIRNNVDIKHTYFIEMSYGFDGIVNEISISYDAE